MIAFAAVLRRDLLLALRQRAEILLAVFFFVLAASIFPFAVGPEPNLLARIAPGVIWVMALLAMLLSLERLFLADYEDGSLEQLVLAPLPIELLLLAKVLAHWLTSGLPLVAAAPLIALFYGLPAELLPLLLATLALGTAFLSLMGAVGATLTLGARRGGVLIPLLVLPLAIPALIFGVAALDAALAGLSPRPHLSILAALALGALVVAPLAGAAALRQALE
ncbi:MAG: heme exporter protein CcmB [Kiloniellales bacterium]